ncbi:MAG: hypothetical protein ACI4A5_06930 [Hominilimicola sp.]
MKKLIILLFCVLISVSPAVYASPLFDEVLSDKLGEYGIFENGQGIVYADEKEFEGRSSLLIVNAAPDLIKCEVYDDIDGIQLTDSLEIPCGGSNVYKLATVTKNSADYLMLSTTSGSKTVNEFFTLRNDTFTKVEPFDYDSVTYIAGYENGKPVSYTPVRNVYTFLSHLKQETISQYSFVNKLNTISAEEINSIRTTLSACADVMRFDIKNYNYDTLFKYVLYTHKNFQVLTDIPPASGSSSSLGYNNVSIVSSDYIDYIMEKVFRITPEKPPVNNLLNRGFCYSDGYYYYTGGFDVYFATEILDLAGVYDIGGGVTFVVFSDVYYEGTTATPEYSFAIVQKNSGGYSMLRLGMGENLPSQEEVKRYSPFSTYGSASWNSAADGDTKKANTSKLVLPVLLLIISVGIVGLVCSIVVFIHAKNK